MLVVIKVEQSFLKSVAVWFGEEQFLAAFLLLCVIVGLSEKNRKKTMKYKCASSRFDSRKERNITAVSICG